MKGYLVVTGTLFGLLGLAHLFRTIAEGARLTADPVALLELPGIGLVALALSVWAWRLFWKMKRPTRGEVRL